MLGVNPFSPNFRGGKIVINDKKGNPTNVISSDNIAGIENVPHTTWSKCKGVYIYTNGNVYHRLKHVPYQTVVEAYEKALNENIDVEIDEK